LKIIQHVYNFMDSFFENAFSIPFPIRVLCKLILNFGKEKVTLLLINNKIDETQ